MRLHAAGSEELAPMIGGEVQRRTWHGYPQSRSGLFLFSPIPQSFTAVAKIKPGDRL